MRLYFACVIEVSSAWAKSEVTTSRRVMRNTMIALCCERSSHKLNIDRYRTAQKSLRSNHPLLCSKMAPAQSKPSDMVKKFTVKRTGGSKYIGRVAISSEKARKALARLAIVFQGQGNKALKLAATNFGSAALIQAALKGAVDQRLVIPVVGRGNGRDTVDPKFYRGNGDVEPDTEDFVLRDGVYFCSDPMYHACLALVEESYNSKVTSWGDDDLVNDPKEPKEKDMGPELVDNLPAVAEQPGDYGVDPEVAVAGVASLPDSDDVSAENSSDEDSKMPAMPLTLVLDEVTKAKMLDVCLPMLAGVNMSVEDKAKVYDEFFASGKRMQEVASKGKET